jgi:N6-L-threonylcarbamoyladenine synthase
MLILGIETSCDDTSAAVVREGSEVLSSIVNSQDDLHSPFGGIVPEMASRRHLERINPVIERALSEAGCTIGDIDLIAATAGPGLVGSLLVGLSAAKGLSFTTGIPLVPTDHIEGHLYSLDLAGGTPLPAVTLVSSGGHTTLFAMEEGSEIITLGTTLDDAAGEALDKAAKMLGLGYPGGPAIEKAARAGDPAAVALPRPMLGGGELNLSFSGLKTALFTFLKREGYFDETTDGRRLPFSIEDLAASFQAAVVDVLVAKCKAAISATGFDNLLIVGGVARNGPLREAMEASGREDGFSVKFPPPELCTDNAAMIAAAGYRQRHRAVARPLDINAYSTKSIRTRPPGRRKASR